ncbi:MULTISPECIES: ABC transporter permease [Pseudoalteromonas]|uniref:Peptide ABC transporter permease n=1 Tax=Pseudoalteromonas amylolytica TaxID=1859457 RepID=A0A1S1MSZ3_9GAMM|nr:MULTISPECIES: ABC transporter permease [Pseudoalteromonas]OHU86269.1 peptide ABC transporter permease [Pseudoalteromonas sp. JW3]OHU89626.1 peptide ABC transporter permease [Pseudoalteromonas amylolytica]
MTLLKLALKSCWNRRTSVLLTFFTIAISVMLLLSIERVRMGAKSSFSNTISGTDLIVGARTGDIQLLLSSVFRIGHNNNAVSWQSYQDIKHRKGVAWTIPISLGDSHKGYAVLGTDSSYFDHYRYGKKQALQFQAGRAFHNGKEVVLGSEVADKLGYHLGQNIVISHGMGNTSFHHHDDNPMTIVGILAPTGTPVDKTLHIPLIAVDMIHASASAPRAITRKQVTGNDPHEHDPHDDHHHNHAHGSLDSEPSDLVGNPKQITAFLMGFDSPLYTLQVRRNINQYKGEPLLAIMPTVTLKELWEMLDIVEKLLLLFSIVVVIISLLGMLTTLLATLSQRRRELAILRSVGARPWHIFSLLSFEATIITLLGCVSGTVLFYTGLFVIMPVLQSQFGVNLSMAPLSPYELTLLGGIMLSGTLMGLIPAARAYYYSLADGMSIKI